VLHRFEQNFSQKPFQTCAKPKRSKKILLGAAANDGAVGERWRLDARIIFGMASPWPDAVHRSFSRAIILVRLDPRWSQG
jgi:hypothetical protein